jgi:hypothetical protein
LRSRLNPRAPCDVKRALARAWRCAVASDRAGMYTGRVSTHDPRDRPSVAKVTRGSAGAFGALVIAAARDSDAARGLALAYAALDRAGRWKIVDAVVADAGAEGISPCGVLASLLSVEEDTEVARHIADAIAAAGGSGLEATTRPRALVAGDEDTGGIILVRPLHGTFVEVLALAWKPEAGVTHALFDPMVHDGDALHHKASLPPGLRFESAPITFAIDLVTPVLWSHRRRHGALPPGVNRFADLFSIAPEPDAEASGHGF